MLELELELAAAALPRLMATPGLTRAGRGQPLALEWHDTPDAALLADGLLLARTSKNWHLSREHEAWIIPTTLAEARDLSLLGVALPADLVPRAWWNGTRRGFRWTGEAGEATLTVLEGHFGHHAHLSACRLSLAGPAPALAAMARHLAQAGARLAVTSLGREAMMAPPLRTHPPAPDPTHAPGEALAAIITAQLGTMRHWAALVPQATTPEPVHQMRVSTRRLRAALSTFRTAAPCAELQVIGLMLKDCAARLGTARDWDVFLDGAGARLARAFPDDARCAAMLRAGARRRAAVYKALRADLAGPAFQTLLIALAHAAATRPWPPAEAQTLAIFAAARLAARFRTVRRRARGLDHLPLPALHELRKDCKRLRYTAEFFAPLFAPKPARRFLAALAALQEELGQLNDGTAIAGLMGQLSRRDQGYAAGLAEGFTAAGSGVARGRIGKAWKRLRATSPFWPPPAKDAKPLIVNEVE